MGVVPRGQTRPSAQQLGNAMPPTALTEDADRCLYKAKRTGRNRVVHSMMLRPTAASELHDTTINIDAEH